MLCVDVFAGTTKHGLPKVTFGISTCLMVDNAKPNSSITKTIAEYASRLSEIIYDDTNVYLPSGVKPNHSLDVASTELWAVGLTVLHVLLGDKIRVLGASRVRLAGDYLAGIRALLLRRYPASPDLSGIVDDTAKELTVALEALLAQDPTKRHLPPVKADLLDSLHAYDKSVFSIPEFDSMDNSNVDFNRAQNWNWPFDPSSPSFTF